MSNPKPTMPNLKDREPQTPSPTAQQPPLEALHTAKQLEALGVSIWLGEGRREQLAIKQEEQKNKEASKPRQRASSNSVDNRSPQMEAATNTEARRRSKSLNNSQPTSKLLFENSIYRRGNREWRHDAYKRREEKERQIRCGVF